MLNEQIDYLLNKLSEKNKSFSDSQISTLIKNLIHSGVSVNSLKDRILNNNFYINSSKNITEDLINFRIDNLNWNVAYYQEIFKKNGIDFFEDNNSIVAHFDNKNILKMINDKTLLKFNPYLHKDNESDSEYFIKLNFDKDSMSPESSEFVITNASNTILKSVDFNGNNIAPSFEVPEVDIAKFNEFYNNLSDNEKLIYCCKNNLVDKFNQLIQKEDIYISANNNEALLTAIDYSSYDIIDRIFEFKKDFIPNSNEDIYNLIKNKEDSMNIDLNGLNNSTIIRVLEKNDKLITQRFLEDETVVLKISNSWAVKNLDNSLYSTYERTLRKNNFKKTKFDF